MKTFANESHDIEEILSNFDFERVRKAMTALDWKWTVSVEEPGSTPSVFELIRAAERHLAEIVSKKTKPGELWATGSGGFMAEVYHLPDDSKRIITLQFLLDEWSNRE